MRKVKKQTNNQKKNCHFKSTMCGSCHVIIHESFFSTKTTTKIKIKNEKNKT